MENQICPTAVSYKVALYDMSIKDVKERLKKRMVFKTAKDGANFLGIVPDKFYGKIGVGKYAYHAETRKKYAVRRLPNT